MESLKCMKDVFTIAFLLMLKQYYQVSFQLIKNAVTQIMSYLNLWKTGKSPKTTKILWVLFLWVSPRLLTVFLMIYLLQNFMHIFLSEDTVTFVDSYSKRRKQAVQTNGTESVFQILLSGIPQSCVLGSILFNILINNLFSILKTFNLHILHMTIQYMDPGIV